MKKKIILPVIAILVLATAGAAMARGGYQNGKQYSKGHIFSQLTPQKQQQVEAIFNKYETKLETIKSQMWAKRTELNALVNSGNADTKTIKTLVSDISGLRNQNFSLRKQISSEIEQATGIVMPVGGQGMHHNNKGHGNHRQGYRKGGGCWNFNS
ncbi:Spy/CpxP family protein refolding chaperone [Maridesulfovibrio hydrothermalis]|uniref:Zinc resistance-associated protein n=1 Tax=Maridesulfovibrio hydrothermalis AM13 = DSM 14728 TaxID=1121451 RepID=L0R714_9BACT|nr:periplasmic heavy metal sensor [Maridesulfovibrio hydrothermalis]CCO22508.1 Zinc resistance-associated protein [Maridesulfovibrio hydrothermalis AM13 = DSM 14728]